MMFYCSGKKRYCRRTCSAESLTWSSIDWGFFFLSFFVVLVLFRLLLLFCVLFVYRRAARTNGF